MKLYIVDVLLEGTALPSGHTVDVTLTITGSLYNGDPFAGNCTIEVKG